MKNLYLLINIFAAVILIVCVFSGCHPASNSETAIPAPNPPSVPRPSTTHGPEIYIEVTVNINKGSYTLGEDIIMEFFFENVTAELFKLEPFPPLIEIGRSPYDSSVLKTFPAQDADKVLDPGETVKHTLTWNQKDDKEQSVPPGKYFIKLGNIKLGDSEMSLSLADTTRQFEILTAEHSN